MRWAALGVDYEMYGKDLIDSVKISSQICRILGGTPPEGFSYELFLDEHGQKISKSKGNGLTVDEWLTYGTKESLKLYMFQAPRKAKRLYFDVIPRHVDDYFGLLDRYAGSRTEAQRYHNPVWHIHDGDPPPGGLPITFAMLLNLASVVNAEEPAVLWSFIERYAPDAPRRERAGARRAGRHALAYYRDFVKPAKPYRLPDAAERQALDELADWLERFEAGRRARATTIAAAIQQEVYEIGKRHGFADDLRAWFRALYEILLGQSEGPRFGSFVAFYGPAETAALIRRVLRRPSGSISRRPEPATMARPVERAPRRAGRARPGAGRRGGRSTTRSPAIRRLARLEPARSRVRPPAGHHHAAPARPDRRSARRASARAPEGDPRARNLLRLGAAQLLFLDTPAHAAVAETVALARGRASLARRASSTPCCAGSRAKARRRWHSQDAARLNTPDWLWQSWCDGLRRGGARRRSPTAHLVEPPLDLTVKAGRRAAGRRGSMRRASVRQYGAPRRRAAPSRSCRATPRAPGGCRMRRPPCRRACSATSPAAR